MTVVWVALAVFAIWVAVALVGILKIVSVRLGQLVSAMHELVHVTRLGVAVSQQNADISKRMADAIDKPRVPQTVFVSAGAGPLS